ncbi:MAG: aminotransferase class V-fold PLP-dependent enzyme [Gemmatimonadales bacterium]
MVRIVQLITDDDVARWRRDTPGTAHRTHLNNAGASLMPYPVVAAIEGHLRLEATTGGYEAAATAATAIASAYADVAALVGAKPRNIAILASATAAFAQAMSAFDFARGDAIVTSTADYVSNQLMFLSLAARRGVRVIRAGDLPGGGVDPDAVRAAVRRERPRLVALTWVPTNTGLVQDAAAVGEACQESGVPFLLDACQALGQLPIDVAALKCDFLSTTARKFLRGPRGIGFLFVADAALARGVHPLFVDMRGASWTADNALSLADDARRFEQWEIPHALLLGLGAAARYAREAGVERTAARAHALAAEARALLAAIPGVRTLDRGAHLCAIAAFECAGRDARDVMLALRARGINTTAQSREDALIDLDRKGASSLLRVSPHYFNTREELTVLEGAMRELLAA